MSPSLDDIPTPHPSPQAEPPHEGNGAEPPAPPAATDNQQRQSPGPQVDANANAVVEPAGKCGHIGAKGKRYTFLPSQTAILQTRVATYNAATNRKQKTAVAEQAYADFIKLGDFKKPEGRTPEAWKRACTMTRWYENNAWKFVGERKVSGSKKKESPQLEGKQERKDSGPSVRIKALTKLFNKLVGGVLTMKTGTDAFAEAHTALITRTMEEQNDRDKQRVICQLWDELNEDTQYHWENLAVKESPISQNQESFRDGLRALTQACVRSGHLGPCSVTIVYCFEQERDADGQPVIATYMTNDWSDTDYDIPEDETLAAAELLMNALQDNLHSCLQVSSADTQTSTVFPVDDNKMLRFPSVDVEGLSPMDGRTLLQDWYTLLWAQSGRKGPVRYKELRDTPELFYDQHDLLPGQRILDPTAEAKAMTYADITPMVSHFLSRFGVNGRAFSFIRPSKTTKEPSSDLQGVGKQGSFSESQGQLAEQRPHSPEIRSEDGAAAVATPGMKSWDVTDHTGEPALSPTQKFGDSSSLFGEADKHEDERYNTEIKEDRNNDDIESEEDSDSHHEHDNIEPKPANDSHHENDDIEPEQTNDSHHVNDDIEPEQANNSHYRHDNIEPERTNDGHHEHHDIEPEQTNDSHRKRDDIEPKQTNNGHHDEPNNVIVEGESPGESSTPTPVIKTRRRGTAAKLALSPRKTQNQAQAAIKAVMPVSARTRAKGPATGQAPRTISAKRKAAPAEADRPSKKRK
ncbi:hypothetical protein PQX77_015720 [Marasmius sp. AFHP31]|nr:hypothetical protein PQX77_015720 [Marasmius sp. AFHP31]